jgi:2-polyprenyl-3-methyl-5-hydroxy-6-metoxy-1,4-benzoquinol methylase
VAGELKYDYGVEDQLHKPYSVVAKVYELIPEGRRVLDVGCYTGRFGALLKRKGCRVTGIEINRTAAERAKLVLDEVRLADIEKEESYFELKGKYDVILFLDILEHCRRPQEVLEAARHLLTRDGFVVASIPNVANWSVRLNLLLGRFDYVPTGLLDETHLRFYTIKTATKLFENSGYRIEGLDHRFSLPWFRVRKRFGGMLSRTLGRFFPGLFSYQMVIKARPGQPAQTVENG